jgi:hypothetical protein
MVLHPVLLLQNNKASFLGVILAVAWMAPCVSADVNANYNIALKGSIGDKPFSTQFNLNDNFGLSTIRMDMQGNGFNAGAGDVRADWDSLGFAQRSYRGLSLGLPVGEAEATIIGGSVVTYDEIGRERQSSIYGVRAAVPLSDSFGLTASHLYTPDDRRDGSISSIGLKYRFTENQDVGLEAVHSEGGNGWQLTGRSYSKKLGIQAHYRQTETGFSRSGNPLLRTNRNGGYVNLDYKLSAPLSLRTNFQHYTDGRDGGSKGHSIRLRYALPKRPQFSVFYQSRESNYSRFLADDDLELGGRSTKFNKIGADVRHNFGKANVLLRYSRVHRGGTALTAINGDSDQVELRLRQKIDRRTRLNFNTVLSFGEEQRGDESGSNLRGYSNLNLDRSLKNGVGMNLGLEHQISDIFGNDGQIVKGVAGFRLPVGKGTAVGVQYRRDLITSGKLYRLNDNSIYITLSRDFNAGKPLAKRIVSREEQRLLAQLDGGVFEDLNGNKVWDAGEPGVPNVSFNLRPNLDVTTDEKGRFRVANLPTGDYKVRMDITTLPIDLSQASSGNTNVKLAARQKETMVFPVVRAGQIKGIVFHDENGNGIKDENEKLISNAVVRAEGTDSIGFTDTQGEFILTGLAPREWRIYVDTALVQNNLESTKPAFINVPANGDITGVQLGLSAVKKEVVDSFVKVAY